MAKIISRNFRVLCDFIDIYKFMIDIYEKDLLKYFYLTRESLDINVSVSDSLGKAELTIFNKILQSKRTIEYSRLIKNLRRIKI